MSADGGKPETVTSKTSPGAPPAVAVPSPPAKAPRSRRRFIIMGAVPVIVLAVGAWFWLTSGRYASTDNAYVQQDKVTITADVSGRIVASSVHENEAVVKGQLLFQIDQDPYRIALAGAEAALSSARLQVDQLRAAYEQALAGETAASDDVDFNRKLFDRQKGLLAKGVSSQATFDAAENGLHTAEQTLSQSRQHVQAALAALGGDASIATDRHPTVLAALARRDQSGLDLKNTEVSAPAAGVVAQADRLQVGQYVTAATPVLSIVENGTSWVEANYKETDLAGMKVGQPATITVDAFPGQSFAGEVASIGAGTGSEFSLLPAQNATGNWIKVVQRIPVRVRFAEPPAGVGLRTGLSASVAVDIRSAPATTNVSNAEP